MITPKHKNYIKARSAHRKPSLEQMQATRSCKGLKCVWNCAGCCPHIHAFSLMKKPSNSLTSDCVPFTATKTEPINLHIADGRTAIAPRDHQCTAESTNGAQAYTLLCRRGVYRRLPCYCVQQLGVIMFSLGDIILYCPLGNANGIFIRQAVSSVGNSQDTPPPHPSLHFAPFTPFFSSWSVKDIIRHAGAYS